LPRERIPQAIRKALSSLSGKGRGSVLETAAADIGKNAGAIEREQGTTRKDGERQALVEWAIKNGKLILLTSQRVQNLNIFQQNLSIPRYFLIV